MNANGYLEYRPTRLALNGITKCQIGNTSAPGGASRIRLDIGTSNDSAIVISGTGNSAEQNIPTVRIQGGTAGSTLSIQSGTVGLAFDDTETAAIPTITTTYINSPASDVNLSIGRGSGTITTLKQLGGQITCVPSVTTWTKRAGTAIVQGAAAIGTLANNAGNTLYNSSGTITTLYANGGTVDFTQNDVGCTVTNAYVRKGGQIDDSNNIVTWSNGVNQQGCGPDDTPTPYLYGDNSNVAVTSL